jgi:type IV fimbrial biogenesis protein FimT
MQKNEGFTTIELLLVVGLMAILMSIAALSYLSMRPAMRLNGASRQMMGDLMMARMKAVNENNDFKVIFIDSQQYQILDDDDGDGTIDAGEWSTTKDIQDNYPGVTLSASTDPTFFPRGSANNATITLSNMTGSKTVSIGNTGSVKIN